MKTKTEAVKVLLKAGWSWDEVQEVLEDELNDIDWYTSLSEYPITTRLSYDVTCDVGEKDSNGYTTYTVMDGFEIMAQWVKRLT